MIACLILRAILHGQNDIAEASKIKLDMNLKIILLDYRNNYVGRLS